MTNIPAPTSKTALIVDDNWHNRQIFEIALNAVGYNVTHADNGLAGMQQLEDNTYHLLILDLQMPKMDGGTLLKRLRANVRHDNMFVMVITANPHMATDEIETLSDYIMMKPIDVVQLADLAGRLQHLHRMQAAC